MKANNYISEKEHKFLLIVSFISFILAFSNLLYQIVESFYKPNSFGLYDISRPSSLPLFNLLTLFIFIALYKSKKFIISFLLTLFPSIFLRMNFIEQLN